MADEQLYELPDGRRVRASEVDWNQFEEDVPSNEPLYELPNGSKVPASGVDWIQYEPDVPEPSWLENVGTFAKTAAENFRIGSARAPTGLIQAADDVARSLSQSPAGEAFVNAFPQLQILNNIPQIGDAARQVNRELDADREFARESAGYDRGGWADVGSQVVGEAVPTVMQAIGAPQTLVPTTFGKTVGTRYPQLRDQGAGVGGALAGSAAEGAVNSLVQAAQVPFLTDPAMSLAKRTAGIGLTNLITSPIQTGASIQIQEAATGQDLPPEEERALYVQNLRSDILSTGIAPAAQTFHAINNRLAKIGVKPISEAEISDFFEAPPSQLALPEGARAPLGLPSSPGFDLVNTPRVNDPSLMPVPVTGPKIDGDRLAVSAEFPNILKQVTEATQGRPELERVVANNLVPKEQLALPEGRPEFSEGPRIIGEPDPSTVSRPPLEVQEGFSSTRNPEELAQSVEARQGDEYMARVRSVPRNRESGAVFFDEKFVEGVRDRLRSALFGDAPDFYRSSDSASYFGKGDSPGRFAELKFKAPKSLTRSLGLSPTEKLAIKVPGLGFFREAMARADTLRLQFGDRVEPGIKPLERFLDRQPEIVSKYRAELDDLFRADTKEQARVAEVLNSMRAFALAEKQRGTNRKFRWNDKFEAFLKEKKGFSDKAIAAARGVLRTKDSILDDIAASFKTLARDKYSDFPEEALRRYDQQVDNLMDEMKSMNYTPLSRFGEYVVYATNTPYTKGRKLGPEDIAAYRGTAKEAKALARALRGAKNSDGTPTYKYVSAGPREEDLISTYKHLPSGMRAMAEEAGPERFFSQIADDVEVVDPSGVVRKTPKFSLEKYNRLAAERPMPGFSKHLVEAAGVKGYDQDIVKAWSEYVSGASRFIASNEVSGKLDKFEAAPELQGTRLLKVLQKMRSDVFSRRGNQMLQALDDITNIYYLAATPIAGVMQASQMLTQVIPHAMGFKGFNSRMAMDALNDAHAFGAHRAMEQLQSLGMRSKDLSSDVSRIKISDPELAKSLSQYYESGIFASQAYRDFADAADRMSIAQRVYGKAYDAAMLSFSIPDKIPKVYGYVLGWHLGKKQGLSGESLTSFAHKFAVDSTGDYRLTNRPSWARSPGAAGRLGAILFKFKQYPLNYFNWTRANFRKKNYKGLAIGYGTLGAVGGLLAIPGAKDILDAADKLGVDYWSVLNRSIGGEPTEFALKGPATYATGYDISAPAGSGAFIPDVQADATWPEALMSLSPAGGLVNKASRAYTQYFKQDNPFSAAKSAAPRSGRNLLLAYELASTGGISNPAGEKVYKSKTPYRDAGMMALGVFPRDYTKRFQQIKTAFKKIEEPTEARKYFNERMARGIVEQREGRGSGTLDNVIEDIKAYNQKYPNRQYDVKANEPHIKKQIETINDPLLGMIKRAPKGQRGEVAEIFGRALTEGN